LCRATLLELKEFLEWLRNDLCLMMQGS
jgi:hypothetical protein